MFTERLKAFINYQNLSIRAFEQESGVKQGTISRAIKNKTSLTSTNLSIIANHWKELEMNWLMTGEGEMIKSSSTEDKVESTTEQSETWYEAALRKADEEILWQRKQIEMLTEALIKIKGSEEEK